MNKKAIGVWIRVSTEDSAKGESPKVHLERAKMYAELQGYEIKEIYDMSGVSGKTVINFPETQRMLYDIKRGHITGLIFSKIARFARNTRELLDFADLFKKYGADMISLQESIDTSTPSGRLFFRHLASMAEWEREEIVDRVNSSVVIRGKMGKRLGGKDPFGYIWNGHKLELNPKEAPIRKLIFELFVQEKRKKTVAKILNERGYKTSGGKKFYDTNINRWLRDPLSKGVRISNHTRAVIVDGKKITEYKPKEEWFFHEAPAIVSKELWQKANDILDDIESKRTKPLNRRTHLFTRFIFCSCGSPMSVHSGNTFYRCNKKGCSNKIDREQFEQIFKEQLKSYVSSKENIEQYFLKSDSSIKDKEVLLKTQREKLEALKKRIDTVIQLHIDGQITKEAFKSYHDKPYNEHKLVQEEVLTLEAEVQSVAIQKESISVVMDEALSLYNNWDKFDRHRKRRLVEMITDCITIGVADDIHIKLYSLMPNSSFFELETNGQRSP